MELRDDIYNTITTLTKQGEDEFDAENYDEALKLYNQALDCLPLPKEEWEATVWIYAAIGDVYFMKKNYEEALYYFHKLVVELNEIDNPFIFLRIGECYYEMGEKALAKDYLIRAMALGGDEIFDCEESKYRDFCVKN